MPDTILGGYSCPCGWVGNSRQALYWHKNNNCKLREQPEAPQKAAPAPTVAKVEPVEPSTVQQEKPQKVALAAVSGKTPEPEPEPEDEDEDEPEDKEPDTFDMLLLPLIIVVFLVAGLVIFREKIVEIFEKMKGGRPPAYGVPDYVA